MSDLSDSDQNLRPTIDISGEFAPYLGHFQPSIGERKSTWRFWTANRSKPHRFLGVRYRPLDSLKQGPPVYSREIAPSRIRLVIPEWIEDGEMQ